MIMINSNFLAKYKTSWIRRHRDFSHQGALHDGILKSDFLIVIHSNLLSGMHDFCDYELLLQVRYHVIVISLPWSASGDFS